MIKIFYNLTVKLGDIVKQKARLCVKSVKYQNAFRKWRFYLFIEIAGAVLQEQMQKAKKVLN